jgi:hypothetical protein
MQKRSRMPRDPSKLAKAIVDMATDQATDEQDCPDEGKSQIAIARGRKGGLRGGPARSRSLTPEKRREIARKAIRARWDKSKKKD